VTPKRNYNRELPPTRTTINPNAPPVFADCHRLNNGVSRILTSGQNPMADMSTATPNTLHLCISLSCLPVSPEALMQSTGRLANLQLQHWLVLSVREQHLPQEHSLTWCSQNPRHRSPAECLSDLVLLQHNPHPALHPAHYRNRGLGVEPRHTARWILVQESKGRRRARSDQRRGSLRDRIQLVDQEPAGRIHTKRNERSLEHFAQCTNNVVRCIPWWSSRV
jgi:hypothetical protein